MKMESFHGGDVRCYRRHDVLAITCQGTLPGSLTDLSPLPRSPYSMKLKLDYHHIESIPSLQPQCHNSGQPRELTEERPSLMAINAPAATPSSPSDPATSVGGSARGS